MDLEQVRQQVARRVTPWDDGDVAVRVAAGLDGGVRVSISSRHPSTYYNQWVDLRSDGTVGLPAPDDGFTSPGARGTVVGTVTDRDDAVQLVVDQVAAAVSTLRERQDHHQAWRRPAVQPAVDHDELAEVCAIWQSGRDGGSSRLRGSARVLTGIDHYFRAGFITEHDESARHSPEALRAGIALLRAVNSADPRDADGWNAATGLPTRGFAGRGLTAKPEDDQILRALRRPTITMPLWGVSLDPGIANSFGARFLLEIVGEFPAVPAWVASGIKDDEQELITGGEYQVLSVEEVGGTTHARLRWIGAIGDRVGSDGVLLDVLGALDGVGRSALARVGDQSETLTVDLAGQGNWAEITRKSGASDVDVSRYYPPDEDPAALDDSEYTQQRRIQAASRTTTVPAQTDDILAAIAAPRL